MLEVGFNLTLGLILFYATQMRELRNFFDHQDTLKKEQQTSQVLNSQSDSIVVVQKPASGRN